MFLRRFLIIAAVLSTLIFLVSINRIASTAASLDELSGGSGEYEDAAFPSLWKPTDTAEGFYPYFWQKAQRERLRTLLNRPQEMPTGSDELSQARYFQWAMDNASETVFREGIRREPNNALYHYLLADYYLTQSLLESPRTDKVKSPLTLNYKITNRQKLDMAMREVAYGLQKPYSSHRQALIEAQLSALPPTSDYMGKLNEIGVLAAVLFPEFGKLRKIERANGFYLQTLLSEGKRSDIEPFLHTGERLVVQTSNDQPLSLIGQLVALALGAIAQKNDVNVCRHYGLNREADMMNNRLEILIGKAREWKDHGRKVGEEEMGALIRNHAGILPAILLPVFGTEPAGLITKESLAPSRLTEYSILERGIATALSFLFVLFLFYTAIKYFRWKIITRGDGLPAAAVYLTRSEWLRIVFFGLLLPLALYLLYISIPVLSWRDHGISSAALPFGIGAVVFILWTSILPTTLAAGYLMRKGVSAGIVTYERIWRTRFVRLSLSIVGIIWCGISFFVLLFPLGWILQIFLLARSPFSALNIIELLVSVILVMAIPFIPALWERKHAESASHHLAIARTMITVYAVMTLFFASLAPVCHAFERHYVRTDQLIQPLRDGENISFTKAEGKLVIMLRDYFREGASKLNISWE